jgi:hypothetical protein
LQRLGWICREGLGVSSGCVLRPEKVAAVNAHIVLRAEQVSPYARNCKVAVRWDEVSGSGLKTVGACTFSRSASSSIVVCCGQFRWSLRKSGLSSG